MDYKLPYFQVAFEGCFVAILPYHALPIYNCFGFLGQLTSKLCSIELQRMVVPNILVSLLKPKNKLCSFEMLETAPGEVPHP